AANRVVLLLEQHLVPCEELDGHRVRMFEVALCRVVNDVLERDVEGRRTELHREHRVRLVTQATEERGVDGGGLFSDESCESGAFRSVSLACRAKTAKQMDL